MGLILLEALLALCILIGIVWWTMFSGRNKGELPHVHEAAPDPQIVSSQSVTPIVGPEDNKT